MNSENNEKRADEFLKWLKELPIHPRVYSIEESNKMFRDKLIEMQEKAYEEGEKEGYLNGEEDENLRNEEKS